jgi:hypothetical protein
MRTTLQWVLPFVLFITFSHNVYAQQIDESLPDLAKDAAKKYVAPLVSGLGAGLNSGWVTYVPRPDLFGFNFNLRIVTTGVFFKEADKSFSTNGNFRFNRDEASYLTQDLNVNETVKQAVIDQILSQDFNVGIEGPTIVGNKNDHIKVNFGEHTFTVNNQNIVVPSQTVETNINGILDDLSFMPLAGPQLTVGTFLGSQVSVRYLPWFELNSEIGKFSCLGFGIMHNPGVWFPNPLPLDIGLGFFTQTMKAGDYLKATATQVSIFAGKTIGPSMLSISPYAGISWERSSISVDYKHTFETPAGPTTQEISFDMKGDKSVSFTVGGTLKISFVSLNVDFSLATYNIFSAGVGLDF